MRRGYAIGATGIFLGMLPLAASAYDGIGHEWSVVQGLVHPIGGLDHALAMIAVGMIAATTGGRALWLQPVTFIAFMALGAFMGANQIDLPNYDTGIALSVVVFGATVASGRSLPLLLAAVLTAVFALCHGYAHGAEMPLESSPVGYAVGFAVATGLLHALGIGISKASSGLGQPQGTRMCQVIGVVITSLGVSILGGWL